MLVLTIMGEADPHNSMDDSGLGIDRDRAGVYSIYVYEKPILPIASRDFVDTGDKKWLGRVGKHARWFHC